MGVAPEAIVEFVEYRLKSIALFIIFFLYDLQKTSLNLFSSLYISSGARPALPMGVAAEAINGCLQPFIGSKLIIFFSFFFFLFSLFFSLSQLDPWACTLSGP
jgi:hypothetical protein